MEKAWFGRCARQPALQCCSRCTRHASSSARALWKKDYGLSGGNPMPPLANAGRPPRPRVCPTPRCPPHPLWAVWGEAIEVMRERFVHCWLHTYNCPHPVVSPSLKAVSIILPTKKKKKHQINNAPSAARPLALSSCRSEGHL